MNDGFDTSQISGLSRQFLALAEKQFPKESLKQMRKSGDKLKRKIVAREKTQVSKKSGDYHKSIKRGKPYRDTRYKRDNSQCIRVYSNSPHAHLVEDGHDQVMNPKKPNGKGVVPGKGIGKKVGHVDGVHVFEKGSEGFDDVFASDVEKFVDEMLDKGLR